MSFAISLFGGRLRVWLLMDVVEYVDAGNTYYPASLCDPLEDERR